MLINKYYPFQINKINNTINNQFYNADTIILYNLSNHCRLPFTKFTKAKTLVVLLCERNEYNSSMFPNLETIYLLHSHPCNIVNRFPNHVKWIVTSGFNSYFKNTSNIQINDKAIREYYSYKNDQLQIKWLNNWIHKEEYETLQKIFWSGCLSTHI